LRRSLQTINECIDALDIFQAPEGTHYDAQGMERGRTLSGSALMDQKG